MKNHSDYISNRNIVYSCKYHVVWCPKYRRHVIHGKIEQRLKEFVMQICLEWHSEFPFLKNMSGLWTNSYFVSTVGGAPLELKQYIEQQKHG